MLPIALNPYLDDILRNHLVRAARAEGVPLAELEDACESPEEALEFLRACGDAYYEAYMEDASAAVDHVGWILIDKRTGFEVTA